MLTTRKLVLLLGAAAGVAVAVASRHWDGRARSGPEGRDRSSTRAVTVDRPAAQVYAFWRDLPTLAGALDRRAEVHELDRRRSQWTVTGPVGSTVRWTAEITEDVPDQVLGWRVDDGPVPHRGRVEFSPAPTDRGTEVRVCLHYELPGGTLGSAVTRLTGDEPDLVLRSTLRRMKQLLECGRVVTVDGQPTGRGPVQERVTRLFQHKLTAGGRP